MPNVMMCKMSSPRFQVFVAMVALVSMIDLSHSDSSSRPRLTMAPANATVSVGVRVTLGCAASTPVRACQWSFYPEKDPDKRHDLAAFSPASKHRRGKGRGDDRDCSVDIKTVNLKHSGFWVCTVMPSDYGRLHLVSKAAFLKVIDPKKTTTITTTTTTTTMTTTTRSTTTSTQSTTTTSTTTTTSLRPRPRALPPPPTVPTSSGSGLHPPPYFIIDRGADGSVSVTWALEALRPGLRRCVWVTPGRRVRLVSGSSPAIWVDSYNSSCGVTVSEPLSPSAGASLSGDWAVVAEYFDGRTERKITAAISIDPTPNVPAAISTTERPREEVTTEAVSTQLIAGLSVSPLVATLILAATCALCAVSCFVIVACCKKCCRKNRRNSSSAVADNKKNKEIIMSTSTTTSSIVGIHSNSSSSNSRSYMVPNLEYASHVVNNNSSNNIQERRLPLPVQEMLPPPPPPAVISSPHLDYPQIQYQNNFEQHYAQNGSVKYADIAQIPYQDHNFENTASNSGQSSPIYAKSSNINKVQQRRRYANKNEVPNNYENRHSVIGIEVPDLNQQPEQTAPQYTYILPRPEVNQVQQPQYHTLLPPRKNQSHNRSRIKFEDYYEHVARPLPPYENTAGTLEFTTFGFSSLQRQSKQRRSDGSSNNSNSSDGDDSGLGLERQPQQQFQQQPQLQQLQVNPQMLTPSLEPPSMEIEMPPPMREIKSILKRSY